MAKEIERKWVVDKFPENFEFDDTETEYITQWYIDGVRYRQVLDYWGFYSWIKTVKRGFGLSREEDESYISEDELHGAMDGSSGLRKIRFKGEWKGYTIEFDELSDFPVFYAEIEFPTEQQALDFNDYPEWFGKEVTYDTNHSMYAYFKRFNDDE